MKGFSAGSPLPLFPANASMLSVLKLETVERGKSPSLGQVYEVMHRLGQE